MVRAPCCEKMGLKKGPWTTDEDQILVSHIKKYGHGNWRALPKQAGLLRCGKSCRLRWMNYLRPDIKRGNFSKEEEEAIITLHQMLGNRWSAIAAKLPGRTDNEIKNVWHTHLKKMVAAPNASISNASKKQKMMKKKKNVGSTSSVINNASQPDALTTPAPTSSERCSSSTDFSSCHTESWSSLTSSPSSIMSADASAKEESFWPEAMEFLPEIDESFWADALAVDLAAPEIPTPPCDPPTNENFGLFGGPDNGDDMEFWRMVFVGAGDDRAQQEPQVPQLINLD